MDQGQVIPGPADGVRERLRRDGPAATAAALGVTPYQLVLAAALEHRAATAELIALHRRIRELERQLALLRKEAAEPAPALPPPAEAAPEGQLGHPWRALFDLLSDAAPAAVSCRAIVDAAGERDPEAAHRLVTRLRRRLAPMGFEVDHHPQGGYALRVVSES